MKPDYKARKLGLPTMPVVERLKAMSIVNHVSGCWEWQGSKRNGYGHTIIGSRKDGTRRSTTAHRLAYENGYSYWKLRDRTMANPEPPKEETC